MLQRFYHCPGAQIRTSDAYHNKNLRLVWYSPCILHDWFKQCIISFIRKVDPSEEIISFAGFIEECALMKQQLVFVWINFCFAYKAFEFICIDFQISHNSILNEKSADLWGDCTFSHNTLVAFTHTKHTKTKHNRVRTLLLYFSQSKNTPSAPGSMLMK
jgi:hypothetical protein